MNTSPSQTRSLLIRAFKQASQFQMETTCIQMPVHSRHFQKGEGTFSFVHQ